MKPANALMAVAAKASFLSGIALAALLFPNAATADVATYHVSMSYNSPGTSHIVGVVGTITLDPDLPMSSAIQSTALSFLHNEDPLLPLEFTFYSGPETAMAWNVVDDRLYISRLTNENALASFTVPAQPDVSLLFGSGQIQHELAYGPDGDFPTLKPASGPDGPYGFLFGRLVTPTGACCLNGSCMVGTEADCLDSGGVYAGDDINCADAACATPCLSDLDGDGIVGFGDLVILLSAWGACS